MTPKILILSETFKSNSGGGITLSNLFKDYPKSCLANAADEKELIKVTSNEICNNFYSLGSNEKKVIRLFSFLQKKSYSGKFVYKSQEKKELLDIRKQWSLRATFVNYFFSFLNIIGIYHLLFRYEISDCLEKWIIDFNPDYIYTQLSNRELINFTTKLTNLTGARLALHIMDDWPSTISKNGLFKHYWQKKIDCEFRGLIAKADILMSISEGMSVEYKKRYKKDFIPFHNPIEISKWNPYSKFDLLVNHDNINILYAGRIGLGTSESVVEIAEAIEELKFEGLKITFQIQTTSISTKLKNKLSKFSCVVFNPIVQYSELPKIFSAADVLVMPIDFTKKGIAFLRYSMPTKASEYMISGTPILVYADPSVSLIDHAQNYGWASVVVENNIKTLKLEILNIINNIDLRLSLSTAAINHAISNYDSKYVRRMFMRQFSKYK